MLLRSRFAQGGLLFYKFRLEDCFCSDKQREILVRFLFVIFNVWFYFQDAEVPWHLIAIATFFTFIKLLGPFYPYWGRIFIPPFSNGMLWRTLWFTFLWYRRPQKESRKKMEQNSGKGTDFEPNER